MLDDFRTLTGWAEGLQAEGADVVVVQGFIRDARVERDGVDYRFVAGQYVPQLPRCRCPGVCTAPLPVKCPDVVHLNSLFYGFQARLLRRSLPSGCAVVMQHHAARPDRGLAALLQRWGWRPWMDSSSPAVKAPSPGNSSG